MVSRRTGGLSKVRMLIAGLVAAMVTVLVPQTASASTVYLDIYWIYCNDQSEPFSDEIRLFVNGNWVGGWNDVDGGERHWYYSSFPTPLNIPFSSNVTINVMELDGQDLNLIGWVDVSESEVGQGEHEGYAYQIDGDYTVRYVVHT